MPSSHERLASTLDDVLAEHAAPTAHAAAALIRRPGARPIVRLNAEPIARVKPRNTAPEPRFLVYSVTKTFTAALLLLLQESGDLALDDGLARWAPEVPDADRITLRMLLNHTAGVPDYGGLASYHRAVRETPAQAWTPERFAAETYEKGLLFEPGGGWAYSNPGYMLLKRVVEAVTGDPYAKVIADRIVAPLGLHGTAVATTLEDLAELAPATSPALSPGGTPVDVRHAYDPGWVSHGVIASTATDVARFLDALFAGRLVTEASLGEMTRTVRVPAPGRQADPSRRPYEWREPSYGLGLMVDPAAPWGPIYGHNGGGPGYSASVFHAPDLGGATVCVLGAEARGFAAEQVVFAVFDELAKG
jgi:D-alanyl-D-alanine carboxypeptidase